ncbi:MAG TPA: hypothetical protein VGM29_05445 [Polyangiaceae bacterium]
MTEIAGDLTTKAAADTPRRGPTNLQTALLGGLAVLPALAWAWGFTVDDALITARVARHLANGLGYRFNAGGAVVDAVTPLGFAFLLAPFARGGVVAGFVAAKWFGALAWVASAALLGRALGRLGVRRRRLLPLLVVAVSLPCAAWAVSGMETGLVTLFATLAVCAAKGDRPLWAGLCAALRPELTPWALALGVARPVLERRAIQQVALGGLSGVAPAVVVALLRWKIFGHALPLAFYAKPSDLEHGLRYTLGGLAFTGLPMLLMAPLELGRVSNRCRGWFAACVAHAVALALAGGDWMALYRLWVPVLPMMALVGAELCEHATIRACALRVALGLGSAGLLAFGLGLRARSVGAERAQLIVEGRSALAFSSRTASEDVGWVGAASDSEVIDLAGVTDPTVAFFPGGHTSKRIPEHWLRARDPDAIVLLLARSERVQEPYWDSLFAREVEQSVARSVRERYRVRTTLPFGDQRYLLLERALDTH